MLYVNIHCFKLLLQIIYEKLEINDVSKAKKFILDHFFLNHKH